MKLSTELRASIDVPSKPPDLSSLPLGGGVVGISITVHQAQGRKAVGSEMYRSVYLSKEKMSAYQETQIFLTVCNSLLMLTSSKKMA